MAEHDFCVQGQLVKLYMAAICFIRMLKFVRNLYIYLLLSVIIPVSAFLVTMIFYVTTRC